MKKNDILDLKAKTQDELRRMLSDLSDEIGKLKTDASLEKTKDTNALRNKKKTIARILTFLSMKTEIREEKEAIVNG